MRLLIFVYITLFFNSLPQLNAQINNKVSTNLWADSLSKTLTLKECISQTFMIPAWSNKGNTHIAEVEKVIKNYQVGGIIFFQGDPVTQTYQTNYYQQLSKVPLLIGIDGEWGPAMRLSGLNRFPYQMTLGAIQNDFLIYQMGFYMGLQFKRMGIHINFAPVVDINTNELNPIIGFRSFGDKTNLVDKKSILIMQGMQNAGILACAKHFPGHGDTDADSHLDLPKLNHSKARLDSVELVPFKSIIEKNVASIMIAHLAIPALEPDLNIPASLSKKVVTNLLKEQLNFKGLIITDALNMKGVTKNYEPGYAELAAIKAGNDILCFPENVPKALDLIYNECIAGRLDSSEIRAKAIKILTYKASVGLNKYEPSVTTNLMADLESIYPTSKIDSVAYAAITIVKNDKGKIPLVRNDSVSTVVWQIGKTIKPFWNEELKRYGVVNSYFNFAIHDISLLRKTKLLLKKNQRIILSIHDQPIWGKNARIIPPSVLQLIKELDAEFELTVVLFTQPYVLNQFNTEKQVIVCYEDAYPFYKAASDILFGKKGARGTLPVGIGKKFPQGFGLFSYVLYNKLPYSDWRSENFASEFKSEIENIQNLCIKSKSAPGGQVLVLKNGNLVYQKAFGTLSWDNKTPVTNNTLFDIASITKIASTSLACMKLYDEGKINLDQTIDAYLPESVGTNKASITIKELLLHEAGLVAWIPFYKKALQTGGIFSPRKDSFFNLQISNQCFMPNSYQKNMWSQIWESDRSNVGRYLYSDLSMIILQKCIETITKMPLDKYVDLYFYKPLKLSKIGFNMHISNPISSFAPTTDDYFMRYGTVQGFVHDPASAMFGGVCGHAGLFCNAFDLACILQMLLNKGEFMGVKYLKASTVDLFTNPNHKYSYRGFGFDKPNGRFGSRNNVSSYVSSKAFGHSGFTGTWAWADPKENIVFIMLTNRTFPDEDNKNLVKFNIRGKALETVYKAIR